MSTPEQVKDGLFVEEVKHLVPGISNFEDLGSEFGFSSNCVRRAVLDGVDVAVKSFKGVLRDRAEHEALVIGTVNDLGIPTLKLLSLNIAKLGSYLITAYDHDIDPLDQVVSGHCPLSRLEKIGYKVGQMMSALHDGGVVHGDCQLKNLFINGRGEIGALDFEQSEIILGEKDREFTQGCDYDLEVLTLSAEREMCSQYAPNFATAIKDGYFTR